jgi:hypothetical protein
MFRAAVLAGALVALAGFAPSTRADLINGSFEQPSTPTSYPAFLQVFGGDSTTIPGWTVVGNDVLLINSSYSEPGNGITFNAQDGQQALDITGAANTGPTDGVTQTVSGLAANTVYALSFWVGNATSSNGSPLYTGAGASIGLVVDGANAGAFVNANQTSGSINWEQFSYQFMTDSTGTATVAFLNSTPTGTNYAGLDNVTLSAVPEPGPLMLCAAGLPLFLGISWFRSRRSSR